MMLIICEEEIPSLLLERMEEKNHIFVYQNFEKIRLEGKEYSPLRSFWEIIDHLKLKSQYYKETYGGELFERESSLMYYVPEGKTTLAQKIETECKKLVEKFGFVKVSRKGQRVKISWNLSK